MKHHSFFRIISLVLVVTFVVLDISWAYPSNPSTQDSTLAAPSALQQNPPTSYSAELKESIFEDGSVLGSVCFIARVLLENNIKINKLRWVIEEELGDCAQYIDVKRIRVANVTLNNRLIGIKHNENIPHDAVVFIPYDKNGRKGFVKIALNPNSYVERFAGYSYLINNKYIAKDEPEKPAYAPVETRPAESPAVKASVEEFEVMVPDTNPQRRPEASGGLFSVKRLLLSAFFILLLPHIAIGDAMMQADYYSTFDGHTSLGRIIFTICTIVIIVFDRMAARTGMRAVKKQSRFIGLIKEGDAKATRSIRDDLESPDRGIRRDAIYLLLEMKNSHAAYKFWEASSQDWYPVDELGREFIDTIFECLEKKINFDLDYTPAVSNIAMVRLGNGKNGVYGKREIKIESPSKVELILRDGTRMSKSGSISLRSLEPISAMAGIAVIAWVFSSLKDLIFTYPQVTAAVGIAAIITFAFTWKKILPFSWYMWLMNNYESRGARKALVAKGAKAVPYLIELLSSDKFWLRSSAIEILAEIKDPQLQPILEPLCKYFGDVRGDSGSITSLSSEQSKLLIDAVRRNRKITVEYTPPVKHQAIVSSSGRDRVTRTITLKPASLNISEYKKEVPIEFVPEPEQPKLLLNEEKFPAFEEEAPLNDANNAKQLEADKGIADLFVLAMRAKRQNQRLIIGLETDWIPGINIKDGLQKKAIFSLMKEIEDIGDTLKSMGLDNVEIVKGGSSALADNILDTADKTHTNLSNVVVLASNTTINSDSFLRLRNVEPGNKPFLAAIDPTELIKAYDIYGEDSNNQLYIRIIQMLYISLEIAAGKEPPGLPIIVSYDKDNRTVIFLPKADLKDYETIKSNYKGEETALAAA